MEPLAYQRDFIYTIQRAMVMPSIHQTLPWRSPNRGLKRDVRINHTTFPVASRWIQTQRGVIAKWWSSLEPSS